MTLFLVSLALAYIITLYFLTNPLKHTRKFMWRRFMNWFPLGMTYSFLYMGRYNLTVAAVALGALMTKKEFGFIASAGATTYALSLLLVGPLVDKLGGKRGMLLGALGSALMNFGMAGVIFMKLNGTLDVSMGVALAIMYSINMAFQSFGAVSTIKVKSYWFHVRERGTFGAIFGTLISLGVFFAFDWGRAIANAVALEQPATPTTARVILNNLFALDGRTVPALWLIFAIPAGPAFVRLVAPDAQVPWSAEAARSVRAILSEAARADAPPVVRGISSAFHSEGSIPGEGETQIFLNSPEDKPVSLTVQRRTGEQPRWFVSQGEVVDEGTSQPRPDTLLWYRIACTLPVSIPPSSVDGQPADAIANIKADYKVILEGLGPCNRTRKAAGGR